MISDDQPSGPTRAASNTRSSPSRPDAQSISPGRAGLVRQPRPASVRGLCDQFEAVLAAHHPPDPLRAASGVVDTVVADAQPYHDRFACDLCQPEQRPAIGSREAPCHRVVHADPVDTQRPRPRHRPLVAPVSSAGRRISCTACTNSLRCSSGRRRRSIRKPGVRRYFIRRRRDRPPALPSTRTRCRQGSRHRAGTDTCSRERPSTAQRHAAPAP
jgi:hypothetical protein